MAILILLVLSIAVNYVDRGALSVSAPLIAKELALDPTRMGVLFSAFFWSYATFQIVAGWLVDRYPVKWVYAGGYLLWSVATAATGWIGQFETLVVARLALGVGESVAYPACSRIIVENFAEQRRGFANALVDAGSKLGPGLSTMVGGLLVERYGWRTLFLGIGLGSLLWLLPWMLAVPDRVAASAVHDSRPQAGFAQILRRRETWGTSLGMFALGYVWYFLISWLPTYLVKERGFSIGSMALAGSLPFYAMAGASLAFGWLSDRWIRSGASATRVRKTFLIAGLLLCGATLAPAAAVNSPNACLALLVGSCCCLGLFTSNVWAVTQTLAGPLAAGKWTGIQNAIGNLGGVLSPLITGMIVSATGSFYLAFAAASAVLAAGSLAYVFLIGPIETLRWETTE